MSHAGWERIAWDDSAGSWLGYRVPEGSSDQAAVALPGGGYAVRDIGITIIPSPAQIILASNTSAIAAKIEALLADVTALIAIPTTSMTAVQVCVLARKSAKIIRILVNRVSALDIANNGDS